MWEHLTTLKIPAHREPLPSLLISILMNSHKKLRSEIPRVGCRVALRPHSPAGRGEGEGGAGREGRAYRPPAPTGWPQEAAAICSEDSVPTPLLWEG